MWRSSRWRAHRFGSVAARRTDDFYDKNERVEEYCVFHPQELHMKITKRVVPHAGSWMLSVVVTASVMLPAQAFEFANGSGEITGSFDTTISAGAAWRTQNRDPALIGIRNGGTARSVNGDDGNLNYNKGDSVFGIAKATHDLELNYRNYGTFVRGSYFYDWVNHDNSNLVPVARDRAGSDAEVFDAYMRGKFDLGDRSLNLRVGSQVVSWGESTFIPNGINVINAVDLARLRAPGAEVKEALIASPMVWASQEVTDQVSVEALILTNFDKTRLEPRGTFFSTNDFVSDGGDRLYLGAGRGNDQHAATPAASLPRFPDRDPKDSGQYGVALRYFSPSLNNTEFGIFAVNYHSRTPFLSGIKGAAGAPPTLAGAGYFVEYPEDIRLYGLSFNTSMSGGFALQGEYSRRPNQPLQIAAPEVVFATIGLSNQITGTGAAAATLAGGTEITGYRRVAVDQLQFTATKAFGPMLGASQWVLLGEIGGNKVDLPEDVFLNGPGVNLPVIPSPAVQGASQTDGYMTASSWGYRLLARMDFNNAIGAINLFPRLAYSHDVKGVGPNFTEGVKAATFGVTGSYKENWQTDLSYTTFWGGKYFPGTDAGGSYNDSANPLRDRDFVALSVSYSF